MSWIYRCLSLVLLFAPAVACSRKMPEPEHDHDAEAIARTRMVATQLARSLERPGIKDQRVLQAMAEVPRHKFVPAELRAMAYDDRPLPIGHGQTISQPFVVAFMTEHLDLQADEKVLEIGTGSGYQAAVLSGLVKDVYTIEIVPELGEAARRILAEEGYKNVHVRVGDGYQGWPEQAPFDAIIVTCAPEDIPQPLTEQLADGGRMVIPVGESDGPQQLYILEKSAGVLSQRAILPVRFVPMTGGD